MYTEVGIRLGYYYFNLARPDLEAARAEYDDILQSFKDELGDGYVQKTEEGFVIENFINPEFVKTILDLAVTEDTIDLFEENT